MSVCRIVARHSKDINAHRPSVKQLGITKGQTEQREARLTWSFPLPNGGCPKLKKIDFAFFLASDALHTIFNFAQPTPSQRRRRKQKKVPHKKGGDFIVFFPNAAIIWKRARTPTGKRSRSRWNMEDRQPSNFISNRFSCFSFSRSLS